MLARVFALTFAALLVSATSYATSINLDFGSAYGTPSNAFGAASGQAGVWNWILIDSTPSGIVDINGGATSVSVTVTGVSNLAGGWGGANVAPTTDAELMMNDFFFNLEIPTWTILISGLSDGLYDVYMYEPNHVATSSGAGTLNGIPFGAINGDFSGTFHPGSNYHQLSGVTVAGGTLTATGGLGEFTTGVAGMQLVPQEATPVPEPSSLVLLGAGLAAGARRITRRSRN